jgi:hypothetical protein
LRAPVFCVHSKHNDGSNPNPRSATLDRNIFTRYESFDKETGCLQNFFFSVCPLITSALKIKGLQVHGVRKVSHLRGPFEKFVDSPYYSESELCAGTVTVSFSKYLPWQAMHFLQRSTHFSKTCCRTFAASFRRIVEQAVLTFHVHFSVSKALPPFENLRSSHCIVSIGLMGEL